MSNEICRIAASGARRGFMLGCIGALALILIWIGFRANSGTLIWQIVFIASGTGILAAMPRLIRGTATVLILTDQGLADGNGTMIAAMDQITRVERGAFAFKPSNGFLITLSAPGSRGWEPGIWWRLGRRVGVGGIIPGNQSKLMADIISAKIAGKDLL